MILGFDIGGTNIKIAINGQPYLGVKGYGGELGHMVIKYDGLPCPCGLVGCYEQYASVTALIRQTKETIQLNPDSLLARTNGGNISALNVFNAKEQGCPVAAAVIDQYVQYITIGLNSLENIFQPDALRHRRRYFQPGRKPALPRSRQARQTRQTLCLHPEKQCRHHRRCCYCG